MEAAADGKLPGEFPVRRFRLRFEADEPYLIRGYRGSAWRGVFGGALKSLVCITRERECGGCLVRSSCAYPYLFETPAGEGADAPSSVDHAPHPYTLAPEPEWRPREVRGETLEVTLFGQGCEHWPYVLHALRQGAERGIGVERVPLRLVEAEEELAGQRWRKSMSKEGVLLAGKAWTPQAPPMPAQVRIALVTPLRVRREQDLVEPERMGFDEFVAALLRRLALLSRFHTGTPWRLDHAGLREAARAARLLRRELKWQDWARYSSRQQKKIPMGGVVGFYDLDMGGLEALWPFLWIGQWTHVGKGAVMGLGRYRVATAGAAEKNGSRRDAG
ncbi:MAG: CRISPR system precrRNA processing endoribonuclease RAMP protein Cas6 [Bryobacteraceae bacterium]|nr:CRISPR system precrRNA processing endoribonuclease RAMP protein Cas6 [Bryobacteraceae bacterium]